MAKKLVISVLIVLVANFLWASASPVKDTVSTYTAEEKADQKKSKIKEDIKHHLQDSHDFHLFTDETTGKHYGFPLPVILGQDCMFLCHQSFIMEKVLFNQKTNITNYIIKFTEQTRVVMLLNLHIQ